MTIDPAIPITNERANRSCLNNPVPAGRDHIHGRLAAACFVIAVEKLPWETTFSFNWPLSQQTARFPIRRFKLIAGVSLLGYLQPRRVSLNRRDTEGPINSRFVGSSITPIKTLGDGKSRPSTLIGQFSPFNVQFITIFRIFRLRRRLSSPRRRPKTAHRSIIRSSSR